VRREVLDVDGAETGRRALAALYAYEAQQPAVAKRRSRVSRRITALIRKKPSSSFKFTRMLMPGTQKSRSGSCLSRPTAIPS